MKSTVVSPFPRSLLAVLLVAIVLLLSACGSGVNFMRAAPSDAVVPYFTGLQDGKDSLVGLRVKDGSEAWRMEGAWREDSGGSAIAGDTLYVLAASPAAAPGQLPLGGTVFALRLGDGKTLWSTPLPPIDYHVGIAADSSAVLVAEGSGGIYALDPTNGAIRWRQEANTYGPPHLGSGVVVTLLADDAPTTASGLVAWRESDGVELWRMAADPNLSIVTSQTTVFGNDRAYVVFARSLQTGHSAWDSRSTSGQDGSLLPGSVLAATDALVLAQTYWSKNGDVRTALVGLDVRTGAQRWSSNRALSSDPPFGGGPIIAVAPNGEAVIYGWDSSSLMALRGSDGTQAWDINPSPYSMRHLELTDGVLVAQLDPPYCELGCWISPRNGRVEALDPATGALYWQRDLPDGATLVD